MSTDTEPKRKGPPFGGRKPGGINGEVRDQLMAVKVAPTEQELINAFLLRQGHKPNAPGVRDYVLAMALADATAA